MLGVQCEKINATYHDCCCFYGITFILELYFLQREWEALKRDLLILNENRKVANNISYRTVALASLKCYILLTIFFRDCLKGNYFLFNKGDLTRITLNYILIGLLF
jgi:hypothetical protein